MNYDQGMHYGADTINYLKYICIIIFCGTSFEVSQPIFYDQFHTKTCKKVQLVYWYRLNLMAMGTMAFKT